MEKNKIACEEEEEIKILTSNKEHFPSETQPEATTQPPSKNKWFLPLGTAAVIAVAVISLVVIPQVLQPQYGELVALGFDYEDGEKMTYNMTIRVWSSFGDQTLDQTVTSTWSMEIREVGENYEVSYTINMSGQSMSMTIMIDRMGNVIEMDAPQEIQQYFTYLSSIPGLGASFLLDEVQVGVGWWLPLNFEMDVPSFGGNIMFSGIAKYRLSEVKNATVAAGTYEVLVINFEPSRIHATYSVSGVTISLSINVDGHMYFEKDSCCIVELLMNESVSVQGASINVSIEMELVEHQRS